MTTGLHDELWLNEPARWRAGLGTLSLTAEKGTDFWRVTHYGFVRDSGHFRGRRVSGDFEAEVKVRAGYQAQYDQAGLMVRLDAERWVKTGIEMVDGRYTMSAVVTHGVSDWSSTILPHTPEVLALRVTRRGDGLRIDYAVDGKRWRMHRLAFFPEALPVYVGPMAASPDGTGFDVEFTALRVDPL
jgi:regulation of enolase protein 1 (concanavalin A-like superfamily)